MENQDPEDGIILLELQKKLLQKRIAAIDRRIEDLRRAVNK
jgi:hypothetical protein